MDAPRVSDPGSWLDVVSRALTHLESRLQAIELSTPARSGELREKITRLEMRLLELEERIVQPDAKPGSVSSPPPEKGAAFDE
jgi:hypothetical protein